MQDAIDKAAPSYDPAWMAQVRRDGTTKAAALDFFDRLAPVAASEMLGLWRGSGVHTGHLLDGMLEVLGWYGKRFVNAETVDPLLFGAPGRLVAVNPARVPLGLVIKLRLKPSALLRIAFDIVRPLLATSAPCARLRMTEYRGVLSATMIYDAQPINDVFRRIDSDTLLGAMDYRAFADPFFFILERAFEPMELAPPA